MRYRFKAFDRDLINAEFLEVPFPDHAVLAQAMASYQEHGHESTRAIVAKYEQGLWRLKPSNRSSGRCLFAPAGRKEKGAEILLVLSVYKKEGRTVPKRVMARALARLAEWKNE